VTIADMTIKNFVDDAVILNAGVQSPLIHDVVMLDTGEQLLKSNPDNSGGGVNNGVVEYCTIGYTAAAPNNYTNGIDLHTTQNWVIRDNVFENILTSNPLTTDVSGGLAGPSILVWNHSNNVTVVGNTFINDQREIAFGLSDPSSITDDNTGGLIANNMICRSGTQHGDVAIGVWNSPNTEVAYNTVIMNGDYANALEYRFATTTGVKILYNLSDSAITQRDSASGTVTGNVTSGVQSSWFVNESIGDLHVTSQASGAIGKSAYLSEVSTDYDGESRHGSGPTDVGADEYEGTPPSGSFNSDPYITTPYLKIPNFGAKPTIYSVQSGNWSSAATWSLGRVPRAGDIVDVNSGTTVNSDGSVSHLGTNEEDRYAMTVLDLIGPTSPQANGYQYTFIGNEMDNDGDGNANNPSNIQWGLAVSNSFYGLIQNNTVFAVSGAGIGVEDGASSFNHFDGNFVANVVGTSARADPALSGDAFWFGNANNYVTNNIASDINGGGWTVYSYGYSIDMTGGEYGSAGYGDTAATIPLAQGDDPSVSGHSQTVNMNDTPILQFSGNEVYGATSSGMTMWWIGTFGDTFYSDARASTVKDFLAWNIGTRAIYGYPTNNLVIDGATLLGNPSFENNGSNYTQGINFDDYMTHNLTIQNCNIQGMYTGIEAPFMVGRVSAMDTTVIQGCYLDNTTNIDLTPARSVNGNAGLSAQTLDIISCTFANPSGAPQSWWSNISMNYVTSDALGTSDMTIPQYVYVTNYNGTQCDNFQVFYTQSNSPTGKPPAGAKSMSLIDGLVLPD
jgi:hypothetical protein